MGNFYYALFSQLFFYLLVILVIVSFNLSITYSFLFFLFPFHFPSLPLCFALLSVLIKKTSWIEHSNIFEHIPNVKWGGQTMHYTIFFSRNRKLAMVLCFWEQISQEKQWANCLPRYSSMYSEYPSYILWILFLHRMLHISIPHVNKNTYILKNMWNIIAKVWEVDVYHNIITDVKFSK